MHIVFINYTGYIGCCGVHIHFLANTFIKMGIQCSVYIAPPMHSGSYFGTEHYDIFTYDDIPQHIKDTKFKNAIIHAWTPREPCRIITQQIRNAYNIPYFIHLEDNEIHIMETLYKQPFAEIQKDMLIHPEPYKSTAFCSPLYFQNFLNNASGISCLIKKLEEHVPTNIPRMTFWPACEEAFYHLPQGASPESYKELGLSPETKLIVYPGNIHKYNKKSISALFEALCIVNNQGHPLKLIRCGISSIPLEELATPEQLKHIINIGHTPAHKLPLYISLSNILIQPGFIGDYDDYRFPSKIPFFLASGRPVILPETNIGLHMKHGKNCFLLKTGSAEEIAHYISILLENKELAEFIGAQGKAFARQFFSWDQSAEKLLHFYRSCLKNRKP